MVLAKFNQQLAQPILRIKNVFRKAFGKYLFVTNTITYVSLYAVGDGIQQTIERKLLGHDRNYDYRRTLRMVMFASFHGPVNHFWYVALDKFVKGTLHQTVFKKLILDQVLFAPYSAVVFFMGMGLLEGKTFAEAEDETKEKFIPTYIADISVWPAAQILNFYLVPSHLRLMYINAVTLCWNTFLSFMKHKESKQVPEKECS